MISVVAMAPQSEPHSEPLSRIVHPTDFSPEGRVAFVHALAIALSGGGELQLLHADEDYGHAGTAWSRFPQVRATLNRWGLVPADMLPGDIAERLGLHVVKTDLESGERSRAVSAHLQSHPADLVVMATGARRAPARWLNPSTAEPIARHARLATLFLPDGAKGFVDPDTGEVRLSRVIICDDKILSPDRALILVRRLAAKLRAKPVVDVLHVGSSPSDTTPPAGLAGESLLRAGPVVEAIVAEADARSADLIVVTTQGRRGAFDAVLGSTAEQVLRRSGRAVLAVPV
jgi:nucleotide-binding universal stress UspA family protein